MPKFLSLSTLQMSSSFQILSISSLSSALLQHADIESVYCVRWRTGLCTVYTFLCIILYSVLYSIQHSVQYAVQCKVYSEQYDVQYTVYSTVYTEVADWT